MKEKRAIKVSDVLAKLDKGETREEIREYYNLSKSDLAYLFKHPSLKGKRTKMKRDFIVEDDIKDGESVSLSLPTSESAPELDKGIGTKEIQNQKEYSSEDIENSQEEEKPSFEDEKEYEDGEVETPETSTYEDEDGSINFDIFK